MHFHKDEKGYRDVLDNIREKAICQYVLPYSKVDLKTMAKLCNKTATNNNNNNQKSNSISISPLMRELVTLIQQGKIENFRIDTQQMVSFFCFVFFDFFKFLFF